VFVGAIVVTLIAAAQIRVLAGSYARRLEHVYSMEALVIVPLTFLGGIFYSVPSLPQPSDTISHLNPVFYVVQALRFGLVGRGDVSVAVALVVLVGFDVLLTLWSALVLRSARLLKP